MTAGVRYRVRPSVRAAHAGDRVVLLDVDRGQYVILSGAVAAVWRGLENTDQFEALLAVIGPDGPGEKTRAAVPLLRILDDLVERGLVVQA